METDLSQVRQKTNGLFTELAVDMVPHVKNAINLIKVTVPTTLYITQGLISLR